MYTKMRFPEKKSFIATWLILWSNRLIKRYVNQAIDQLDQGKFDYNYIIQQPGKSITIFYIENNVFQPSIGTEMFTWQTFSDLLSFETLPLHENEQSGIIVETVRPVGQICFS